LDKFKLVWEEREVGGFVEREKSGFGKKSEGINEQNLAPLVSQPHLRILCLMPLVLF